jgi:hypothetical protein
MLILSLEHEVVDNQEKLVVEGLGKRYRHEAHIAVVHGYVSQVGRICQF